MDTENLPRTRKAAQALGVAYYFTGLPCKHGHIAPRKTKGVCVECMREEWVRSTAARADYFRQYGASEAGQNAKRAYYERNREAVIARAASRPAAEQRKSRNAWKAAHPEQVLADNSNRRRRHREATPPWLTRAQRSEMRELYQIAAKMTKMTGERYVVDHIVPLRSEVVCGLHVPWNLRVMTQAENLAKSNKLLDPASLQ